MSDDTTTPAQAQYPDGSVPPTDPETGLLVLEDRTEEFPQEPVGRRLGSRSGMSGFRGLMAKRAERAAAEPATVAPDTDEERAAALALAAEKGHTEADLVDSDGNPLDVAGIHASLAVEGAADGDDSGDADENGGDAASTPEAAAEAAEDGEQSDGDDDGSGDAGDDEEPPADDEPEAPADEAFDPSAHTVTEVQAYLDEHADQATYVLDRERTGKARVTLIGA